MTVNGLEPETHREVVMGSLVRGVYRLQGASGHVVCRCVKSDKMCVALNVLTCIIM